MWFQDTTQQLTPLQPPKPEPPPLLIGCVSSVRYGTASPTAYRAMGKISKPLNRNLFTVIPIRLAEPNDHQFSGLGLQLESRSG
jgi:hypothetical protein